MLERLSVLELVLHLLCAETHGWHLCLTVYGSQVMPLESAPKNEKKGCHLATTAIGIKAGKINEGF